MMSSLQPYLKMVLIFGPLVMTSFETGLLARPIIDNLSMLPKGSNIVRRVVARCQMPARLKTSVRHKFLSVVASSGVRKIQEGTFSPLSFIL